MLTAIVGINWGDEGKGRMVDLLSRDSQIVVRYQGDVSSEHTIVTHQGRYVLNLLPAGIIRPDVVCVMGNGMVIDPAHLEQEIAGLRDNGIQITPANLKISHRATVSLPLCGTDMASVYGKKAMNQAIRMGDLLHPDYLHARLGEHYTAEVEAWAKQYADIFRDYICDIGPYLEEAHAMGMDILFEAPQGALRDVDFGIYPYTCSSSTVAAYATIGAGIPGLKLNRTIGIMKAFSSMVGEGPFPAELFGDDAQHLMETGNDPSL